MRVASTTEKRKFSIILVFILKNSLAVQIQSIRVYDRKAKTAAAWCLMHFNSQQTRALNSDAVRD